MVWGLEPSINGIPTGSGNIGGSWNYFNVADHITLKKKGERNFSFKIVPSDNEYKCNEAVHGSMIIMCLHALGP